MRPKKESTSTEKVTCKKCAVEYLSYKREKSIYCSASCRSKDGNFGRLQNHTNWKGDKVGYWGIHKWINRNFIKPTVCSSCGVKDIYKKKSHWANISGEYRRDIEDWKLLCAKCHNRYDRVGGKTIRSKFLAFGENLQRL